MKISLLQTGKTTDRNITALADIYTTRINKHAVFEVVTIADLKNAGNMPVQEVRIKEGKRILQSFTNDDFVVLLDERGQLTFQPGWKSCS